MYKMVTVAALQAALILPGIAMAQDTDIAILEIGLGSMDLSGPDNDSDFDSAGVFVLNGQAQARTGNLIFEIQGVTTGSVDDGEDDENSTSFGAYMHYMFPMADGEMGVAFGLGGGTNVEENDGAGYYLGALEYASGDWMVGLGHVSRLYGQDSDDQIISFNYVQGAYNIALAANTSVQLGGYVGIGDAGDTDPVSMYELNATLYQDFTNNITGFAGASIFSLSEGSSTSDRAAGYDLTLGLSIAIGGSGSDARDSIPVDIPYFHREFTWADEAF